MANNTIATAYVSILPTVSKTGLSEASTKLKDGLDKASKTIIKATGVAVAGIVTAAVKSFAEFEQLQGGMDKIFGEGTSKQVRELSGEYEALGFSMNSAQETILTFASSLKKAGGGLTEANTILTDMADNSSIFGTDIESLQNAYAGFAKQQFNMLDNLKLGYGGSQTEMQKLLNDAEKLTGKKYDISNFADVTSAIHEIQEVQNIAGNAANEAQNTISGAWATVKADFEDLAIAIGSGDGVEGQIKKIIDDAKNLSNNVLPVVKTALSETFGAVWATSIGKIATAILGLAGVFQVLITIIKIYEGWQKLAKIATMLWAVAQGILNAVMSANPVMLVVLAIAALIGAIVLVIMNFESVKEVAIAVWEAIVGAVVTAWNAIVGAIQVAWDSIVFAFNWFLNFIKGFWKGILDYFLFVWDTMLLLIIGWVKFVIDNFDKIPAFIQKVWDDICKAFEWAINWIQDNFAKIPEFFESIWTKVSNFVSGIWDGICNSIGSAIEWLKKAFNKLPEWFSVLWNKISTTATSLFKNIVNGIISAFEWLINNAIGLVNGLIDGANRLLEVTGASIPKIPTVSIPRLADGGLITQRMFAEIGEAGPEVVIPLDRLNEFSSNNQTISISLDEITVQDSDGTFLGKMKNISQEQIFINNIKQGAI